MTVMEDVGALFYVVKIPQAFTPLKEIPDFITNSIPYFLLMILLEFLYGKLRKRSFYNLKDTILSISLGIVQVLVGIWMKELAYIPYSFVYEYTSPIRLDFINKFCPWVLEIPTNQLYIIYFYLGLIGVDMGYYFYHRFAHEWHIIWSSHSVHHSGERYNFATALRQGSFQQCTSWIFYLPLAVLGLPLAEFTRHYRLNTVYQFWIHTEIINRLPWFIELIFNTASHHRLHHRPPGNCNYAGVFIIWDRLFGTFVPECGWPEDRIEGEETSRGVIYGLAKPLDHFDPVYANLQHMLRMSIAPGVVTTEKRKSPVEVYANRVLRFFSMSIKKRVHHPWRVVTLWSEFAPDIIHDWESKKSWLSLLFELPPNVDHIRPLTAVVPVPNDVQNGAQNGTVHAANGNTDDHAAVGLTSRDISFIQGRVMREGKDLNHTACLCAIVQFVVTLAVAVLILLNDSKLVEASAADPVVRRWFGTLCAVVVLSLQLIRFWY